MACKDKRKVWVDIKGHDRRVLKCQNKAAQRKRISKKKITKPLNIADFARAPGYRRSQRKKKATRIQLEPPNSPVARRHRGARPIAASPEPPVSPVRRVQIKTADKLPEPIEITRYPRQPAPKRAARKFAHFYPKNPPMFED